MLLRRPPPHPSVHLLLFFHLHISSGPSDATLLNDPWIAKVVSTVFLLSPSPAAAVGRLTSFREVLTPSVALEAIRRLGSPKSALKFFELTRSGFRCGHSLATYHLLIRMLCQSRLHGEALAMFDRMRMDGHSVDGPVLGLLVDSYAQAGELDAAMGLLSRVSDYKCRVGPYVYNNLMSALMMRNRPQEAVRFFGEQLSSLSFTPNTCSFNIIIKGLCRLRDIDRAFEFSHDMRRFRCLPNTITYNILIDGLCRAEHIDRGYEVLKTIRSDGSCLLNVKTYTSIISGYCKLGEMEAAFGVFDEMVSFGIRPNGVTYNVLIDGYGKMGDLASAVSMFEKMMACGCSPDVVTFTSLIDGYCRSGQVDDALKLWHEMGEKKLAPNAYTFSVVINALCKENRLSEARNLLTELKGRGDVVARPFIYNPVIDGFCKAGNVDEANSIMGEMEEKGCSPDKLTYTILIIGHCMKGRMSEAIALFHKMITTGCAPDNITVRSLLSCLLKAGMPNETNRIMLISSGKDLGLDLSSSRKIPCSLRKNVDIPAVT